MPTPFLRQNGIIDVMPSLLLSTLAAAVVALPVGKAVFERAPPPKFTVQAENRQSQLTTGIPAPSVAIPQGKTLPDFAPPRKVAVQIDHYPNLPVTTFSLPALAPAVVIDLSTVEKRPQIAVEQIQRPLTLVAVAAVAIPPGQQSYESSRPKFAVEVDIYPDTVLRGIPQPYPYFTDHFTAARPKIQIQAEQYPTLIRVTLPDFAPIGLQLQDHESKPHYEVIALSTPNLTLSTLIPPAGALPQGVQVSDSAPTIYTHATPQIDDFQSLLGLNPPPPPVTPVVPGFVGAGGGVGGYRCPQGWVWDPRKNACRKIKLIEQPHRHLKALLDEIGAEILYGELTQPAASEATQSKAAKLVKPFSDDKRSDVPAPEAVDWAALERDAKRTASLVKLWLAQQTEQELQNDDDDFMLWH